MDQSELKAFAVEELRIEEEERLAERRRASLRSKFPQDIAQMQRRVDMHSGVSKIAANILKCIEPKSGMIDSAELRSFDAEGLASASRLIALMFSPSEIPRLK